MGFLEDVTFWEVWFWTTLIFLLGVSPTGFLLRVDHRWIVAVFLSAAWMLPVAAALWFIIWLVWQV